MPIERCQGDDGRGGWRWGESGTCYVGPDAYQLAEEQARAAYAAGYREDVRLDAWDINEDDAPSPRALLDMVRGYLRRLDAWAGSRMAMARREFGATRLDGMDDEDRERAIDLIDAYVVGAIGADPSAGGPPRPPTPDRIERVAGPDADRAIRAERKAMLRAGMPPRLMAVRVGVEEFDPGDPETMGRLIGVQLMRSEAERAMVRTWAAEAASYFDALPNEFSTTLTDYLVDATGDGWTWQKLRDEVRRASPTARAELIARDQLAKLNSRITENMHAAAGVTEYIWDAVMDQATRQVHADADGEVVSWSSDGWPGAGFYGEPAHAGQGGQCRCTARPIPPADWSDPQWK